MKRSSLLLLAISSALFALGAHAADRPHYGGTLRVQVRESAQSLDPATVNATALESFSRLVFETVVSLDDRGRPQPLLATSWQPETGSQRWRFQLRSGVFFTDGAPLDATAVTASLRASNPEWKVIATGDAIVIETEKPALSLPAELALARNGIVHRNGDLLTGTGPFTIAQWTAGQHATLKANEQYWGGRAFLDSIEIEFGKNDREQLMALDLGKADLVQIAAENIRRTQAENRNVIPSAPSELIALLFTSEPHSDDELHARNALAAAIDKSALNDVVLQGGGEPAAALLPDWLSGYGFVFSTSSSPFHSAAAVQMRPQKWALAFDSTDSLSRIIAQRIALNARDAGITIDLNPSQSPDIRLVRISLHSDDAHVALTDLSTVLQLPAPRVSNESVAELYSAEKALLQSHRVIPVLHLRSAVALRPTVRDFGVSPDGIWRLDNVWLSAEKP